MKIQTTNIFKYTLNGACLALRPQEVYDRQGFFHFLALKVSLRHAYWIDEIQSKREKKRKHKLEEHLIRDHLDSNETKSLKVRYFLNI